MSYNRIKEGNKSHKAARYNKKNYCRK